MFKFHQCNKNVINSNTYIYSYSNIYLVINKSCSRTMQKKTFRVFSTFESIFLKYLKSLQSGCKLDLFVPKNMWAHLFRSEFGSYPFIFLVMYLAHILFLLVCVNFSLLQRREVVVIYCNLILDLSESIQARILFPAQYRTRI